MFDASIFKQRQRENWTDLAAAWLRWEHIFEEGAFPVTRWMELQSGLSVGRGALDLATGLGASAFAMANLVGSCGHVVAQDISPEMIRLASQKGVEQGLTQVTFMEGDADELTLGSERFHAVTSRWGLMFIPDLSKSLGSVYRILKPGGRVVLTSWAAPPKVPVIALGFGEAARILDLPPPPPASPGPFSLSDSGQIVRLLSDAGFTDIVVERKSLRFPFASLQEFVRFTYDLFPTFLKQKISESSADEQACLSAAILEASERVATSEEQGISIPSEAICVAAAKPESRN